DGGVARADVGLLVEERDQRTDDLVRARPARDALDRLLAHAPALVAERGEERGRRFRLGQPGELDAPRLLVVIGVGLAHADPRARPASVIFSCDDKTRSISRTKMMRPAWWTTPWKYCAASPSSIGVARTSPLAMRSTSPTPSTTRPTIFPSMPTMMYFDERVAGVIGRSKRLRRSTMGMMAPRSSITPSMKSGTLGTGVIFSGWMISFIRMMSSAYSSRPTMKVASWTSACASATTFLPWRRSAPHRARGG